MPVSASHHRPPSRVTCGLLAPCRRALTRLLRVPASAALSIRAFRFRSLRKAAARMSPQRRRRRTFRSVRAVFWPLVPPPPSAPAASAADGDDAARGSAATTELLLAAREETPTVHAPVASPETPAYVKVVARLRSGRGAGDDDEEEEGGREKEAACRSFESCLMEMLVEEGKARDLQDVEELLRCWERLKSPVFVDLVSRFYGELCNDMFPAVAGDDDDDTGRDGGDAPVSASSA